PWGGLALVLGWCGQPFPLTFRWCAWEGTLASPSSQSPVAWCLPPWATQASPPTASTAPAPTGTKGPPRRSPKIPPPESTAPAPTNLTICSAVWASLFVGRSPSFRPYEFDNLQCCLLLFAQFAHEFLLPEGIASRSWFIASQPADSTTYQ